MMKKKMVIAGGTGFLGNLLSIYFKSEYNIYILTRNQLAKNHVKWDAKTEGSWGKVMEDIDVLINLTGKSVDCRYHEKNKKLIHNSRIQSTRVLNEVCSKLKNPPKVWINSSSATIYNESYKEKRTEKDKVEPKNFSQNVCIKWEKEFNKIQIPNTRKVIVRTSIVFGKKGGAYIPLKRLVRFGFGGKQGPGIQMVSWLHELDFCRAIQFIIENQINDAVNLCSPNPVMNKDFMRSLRESLDIVGYLNLPSWKLEIGASIIRTETEMILKSRYVYPEKLIEKGFEFKYDKIGECLNNLAKK